MLKLNLYFSLLLWYLKKTKLRVTPTVTVFVGFWCNMFCLSCHQQVFSWTTFEERLLPSSGKSSSSPWKTSTMEDLLEVTSIILGITSKIYYSEKNGKEIDQYLLMSNDLLIVYNAWLW